MTSCSYRFIDSSLSQLPKNRDYDLVLRQQPSRAKINMINERDKRAIEPPPIVQLKWIHCTIEEQKQAQQSPYYFLVANITSTEDDHRTFLSTQEYLLGPTVSSLYKLRDIDNSEGGFFVFGDLAIKRQGIFKLHFSLFELVDGKAENRRVLVSNEFTAYSAKQYPGPIESTFLSRAFSDQGIKMKVKKEYHRQRQHERTQKRKHSPSSTDVFKEEIVSPPSYASSSDYYFGRWQSKLIVNSTENSDKKMNFVRNSSRRLSYTSDTTSPTRASSVNTVTASNSSLSSSNTATTDNDDWVLKLNHSPSPFPCHKLPPLQDSVHSKHNISSYDTLPVDISFLK